MILIDVLHNILPNTMWLVIDGEHWTKSGVIHYAAEVILFIFLG
jgi:hypothetical protein